MRSPYFAAAAAGYQAARADFEEIRAAAYQVAEEATRGALLNARGRRAGVDPYSLFMGSWRRAQAYASPELIEHWLTHSRPTFAAYEIQHYQTNMERESA